MADFMLEGAWLSSHPYLSSKQRTCFMELCMHSRTLLTVC